MPTLRRIWQYRPRNASRPGVSVTRPETIAIDGTEYPPFNLDYGATCDKTQLRIGTFFTSTAAAAVAVEFDHVVLRWE